MKTIAGSLLLLVLVFSQLSFGQLKCEELLNGPRTQTNENSSFQSLVEDKKVALSQASRLLIALDQMPDAERAQLLSSLNDTKLREINRKLIEGELSPNADAHLARNAGLDLFYQDLADLSAAFPGLLGRQDSGPLVSSVLQAVVRQELRPQASNPQILESQTSAPRLRRTIDDTIENLIRQALSEYRGMNFGRTGLGAVWYKIRRFVSPTYKKVQNISEAGEFYQRQLERLRLVDSIAIRQVIGEATTLRLSEQEFEEAVSLALDSPEEIGSIETALKEVFGESFRSGVAVEIGQFNFRSLNKVATRLPTDKIRDSFDKKNVDALKKMNELINTARARSGMDLRTEKEFELDELRIYFEAFFRRIDRYRDFYNSWIDSDSNETYTVERRRERQVEDGKDDNGNTKYKTEVYYVDDTVTPTFRNILENSYDQGDRNVSGLNDIIARTERMRNRENVFRSKVFKVQDLIEHIIKNYEKAVLNGQNREQFLQSLDQWIRDLPAIYNEHATYRDMSDSQIRAQYGEDSIENFRGRNTQLNRRLINLRETMVVLRELLNRNQLQLEPSFDRQDFTGLMDSLKYYRNRNYIFKSAIFANLMGATGFTIVFDRNPAFQDWVTRWAPGVANFMQNLF